MLGGKGSLGSTDGEYRGHAESPIVSSPSLLKYRNPFTGVSSSLSVRTEEAFSTKAFTVWCRN
ncbi:hypothetical protein BN1708_010466 [Verticillium longisporum]|uniref:Uncharacterized protein n=1 Tax=Verticillium longisporum TaxID=100787 RepID=A0A0G4KRD9_VERLO|nr:hypothetical protein BN1708_010466 [Verticillium longisporum]